MSRKKYYILTYLQTPEDYKVEALVGTLVDELRRYAESRQLFKWTIYEGMELDSNAHANETVSR